jgi:hypothetical protein
MIEYRQMFRRSRRRPSVALPIPQYRIYIDDDFMGYAPTTNTSVFIINDISESEESHLIKDYQERFGVSPVLKRILGIEQEDQPVPSNKEIEPSRIILP